MTYEQTPREAAEQAMAQAVDRADRDQPGWSDRAYQFLIRFAEKNRRFQAWEVRQASIGHIDQPAEPRAWGGVFNRAARDGVIRSTGYAPVQNPGSHCRPQNVWVSCIGVGVLRDGG